MAIQISFELRLKVFTHDLNSAFGRASDDHDSLQYVINASVMNGCHKSSITCMKRKKSDSIVTPSCKLKANRPAECSMLSFHIREHGSSSEVRMQSHNS